MKIIQAGEMDVMGRVARAILAAGFRIGSCCGVGTSEDWRGNVRDDQNPESFIGSTYVGILGRCASPPSNSFMARSLRFYVSPQPSERGRFYGTFWKPGWGTARHTGKFTFEANGSDVPKQIAPLLKSIEAVVGQEIMVVVYSEPKYEHFVQADGF